MSNPQKLTRAATRRVEILSAARQMFVGQGTERTTMAEIAARIGVAEGTVYLSFDSKRDLMVAVVVDWFGEITDETAHDLEAIAAPADRLRFLIQRHLDVILRHSELYLMFIREIRASADYRDSDGRALNRRYTDLLRQTIATIAPADAPSPAILRDLIYGGVEHVAWSAILRGEAATVDTAALAGQLAQTYGRALGLSEAPPDLDRRLARIEQALGISDSADHPR